MAKDYETEDGSRIIPLGEVDDFEIAEGYSDVRGWRVDAADGTEIGKVHELLVDIDAMRTRYLDVRLTTDVANAPEDRDVLVPMGAARLDGDRDVVTVPLNVERVGLLPPYTHGPITREQEYEVRRHFTMGRSAAETLETPVPPAAQRVGENEVRVPLQADDSVVVKRGEGGQDEIIIRRPRSDERSAS
jgi:sporulation protein YlmC with PRC-barrel domain